MRPIIISWIVFSTLSTFSVSAQKNIDSLKQELNKNITDSLRIHVLISLTEAYQTVNFSECFPYAEEAIKLAEKKDWQWAKARAYSAMGYLYTLSGDYSTSIRYDNMALQASLTTKDTSMIARAFNNVGCDYHDFGEYDEAYFYLTQAFTIARTADDSLMMGITLHNVGRIFIELGQYSRALDHLNLSLKISEKIKDNMAKLYYYEQLGQLQSRTGDYDSALVNLLHALNFIRKEGLIVPVAGTLTKIANAYLQKGDFEKAFAYYDSAYGLHQKTNNRFILAEVELGRGKGYLKQQRYDLAQRSTEKSLALARALNARVLEIQCFENLYTIWEQKGDYYKALQYLKQFKALDDSLFSQEMQMKLYRDQVRFETASKDSQISAALSEAERQKEKLKREEFIRNILVVVFALSVILLFTVYRSGQRRKQINTLLLEHQEEAERRREELERLNQVKDKFFSIISHDLRSPINALSGILDLMAKGALKPEDFAQQTQELRARFNHTRTLLNNLLDWTLLQMDKLSLQPAKIDLQKIVDENIQLLGSVQTKKINLVNKVPENSIGFADSNTINLVIRNLMTNAIKFTNDGGEVVISADERAHDWLMSVQDNGIGMKPEVLHILFDKTSPYTTRGTANEKGTGLGLILCKEFVEKNGGQIWVKSTEGKGSTFWFTVPKPSIFDTTEG